jgi:thiamine biosynthesis lipoprotein
MNAYIRLSRKPVIWCGAALCLAGVFAAYRHATPQTSEPVVELAGSTMGTFYTVKLIDPPLSVDLESLEEEVRDQLAEIDVLMSTYRSDSEISRLNRSDHVDWLDVSQETALVVSLALEVGRLTDGAFDITAGPLVNLWNFGPEQSDADRVPSPDEITVAKEQVGWELLEVRRSPPAVKKKQGDIQVDLSAIAKGFAVDRIAEYLEGLGTQNYLVEIGGELRALGHNAQGKPWQVAIESPLAGIRAIHRVLGCDGLAMATSGDYRNFFKEDGKQYSHIIDPRLGHPVSHDLVSVTVLDPSCARADALATALMVLGPDVGYELALEKKLTVLLIVERNGELVEKATPSFRSLLQ